MLLLEPAEGLTASARTSSSFGLFLIHCWRGFFTEVGQGYHPDMTYMGEMTC